MTRFDRLSPLARAVVLCGVVLGAFVILFVAAEAAVRVRAWVNYGQVQSVNDLFHIDPKLHIRMPNPNTDVILARRDHVQINSHGFRSPELPLSKPANTIRIAFLGESTTFGAEASSNDMTWAHLVNVGLQKRFPDVRFEWINAAVSGYVVKDSIIRFQNQVVPFHPDIVVVYHGNNDLAIESLDIAVRQHLVTPSPEEGFLAKHSYLVFLVEKNLRHRESESQGEGHARKLASSFDFRPLADEFKDHLRQLIAEIEQTGAIPVVVKFSPRVRPTQTPDEQLAAVQSSFQTMPYMTPALLLAGYKAFNEAIEQLGSDPRVIVVGDEFAIPATAADYEDAIHFRDPGMVAMSDRVVKVLASDRRIETLVETMHNAGHGCPTASHDCSGTEER